MTPRMSTIGASLRKLVGGTYPDLYWRYTRLHLPMDGADNGTVFADSTGASVTVYGNTCTKTGTKLYGAASGYFDGTGDYLTAGTASDFTHPGLDYTLELWFNPTSVTGTHDICGTGPTGATHLLRLVGTTLYFYQWSGSAYWYLSSFLTITTGTWYHVAVVRVGSSTTLYVNGANHGTASYAYAAAPSAFAIGRMNGTTGQDFAGYICDLRYTRGAARYTTAFTPPSLPHPIGNDPYASRVTALLNLSTLTNSVGASVSLFGNTATSTTRAKFGTTSTYFDGTGDYLTTTVSSPVGTGDFTIEYWVNYDNISSQKNNFDLSGYVVNYHPTGGNFKLYANAADRIIGTTVVALNTWYHIALVRSSGNIKMYVNGVQEGSTYADSTDMTGTTLKLSDTTVTMSGYMQCFRVTNFARYTSTFTTPTGPFSLY